MTMRLNEPSHLEKWLEAHGLTPEQGLRMVPISRETWEWLLMGYPTVPTLALEVGAALGMTEEEVQPLGKRLRGKISEEENWEKKHPIEIDPRWWRHLKKAKADMDHKRAGRKRKPAPAPLPEIAEKVPQKKLTEEEALAKRQAQRHRYYEHKKAMARGEKEFLTKTCALCGKEFTMPYGIGRARRYCSPECQDLALKIKQKNYNLKRRQTDGQGQDARA